MRRGLLFAALLTLVGCTSASHYQQAVAVVVDTSGTYADEKAEVARTLKREVLPDLVPGDTLLLVRIDSDSYEKQNVELLVTLDTRPSHANAQKLAISKQLDRFAAGSARSRYTDIPGALMLAAEYLHELDAGSRVILLFSDLAEDLPVGTTRSLDDGEFDGIQITAVNTKRLHSDNADPQLYRGRLASWESRTLAHGATGWSALVDSRRLPKHLAALR